MWSNEDTPKMRARPAGEYDAVTTAHRWHAAERITVKTLGILMLDTRFPRVPGDVGNPSTFDMPVRFAVVRHASPQRIVRERDTSLLAAFIGAGQRLVREGADAITTSCGFLVLWQHELQAALDVPVWTSSLLLLRDMNPPRSAFGAPPEGGAASGPAEPDPRRLFGCRSSCGVITIDAASLGADHLRAAGADVDTPIEGISAGSAFQRSLLEDRPELDAADAQQQVVGAAQRLLARHPELTDIVLECTNMPPYADAVRRATGRRVHDITTLVAQRLAAQRALH